MGCCGDDTVSEKSSRASSAAKHSPRRESKPAPPPAPEEEVDNNTAAERERLVEEEAKERSEIAGTEVKDVMQCMDSAEKAVRSAVENEESASRSHLSPPRFAKDEEPPTDTNSGSGNAFITFSDDTSSSSAMSTISSEEPLDVVVVHDGAIRSAALGLHLFTPRASEFGDDEDEEEHPEHGDRHTPEEPFGEGEGDSDDEDQPLATSCSSEMISRSVYPPSCSTEFESVERSPRRHHHHHQPQPQEEEDRGLEATEEGEKQQNELEPAEEVVEEEAEEEEEARLEAAAEEEAPKDETETQAGHTDLPLYSEEARDMDELLRGEEEEEVEVCTPRPQDTTLAAEESQKRQDESPSSPDREKTPLRVIYGNTPTTPLSIVTENHESGGEEMLAEEEEEAGKSAAEHTEHTQSPMKELVDSKDCDATQIMESSWKERSSHDEMLKALFASEERERRRQLEQAMQDGEWLHHGRTLPWQSEEDRLLLHANELEEKEEEEEREVEDENAQKSSSALHATEEEDEEQRRQRELLEAEEEEAQRRRREEILRANESHTTAPFDVACQRVDHHSLYGNSENSSSISVMFNTSGASSAEAECVYHGRTPAELSSLHGEEERTPLEDTPLHAEEEQRTPPEEASHLQSPIKVLDNGRRLSPTESRDAAMEENSHRSSLHAEEQRSTGPEEASRAQSPAKPLDNERTSPADSVDNELSEASHRSSLHAEEEGEGVDRDLFGATEEQERAKYEEGLENTLSNAVSSAMSKSAGLESRANSEEGRRIQAEEEEARRRALLSDLDPAVQWVLENDAYYEELRLTKQNAIVMDRSEEELAEQGFDDPECTTVTTSAGETSPGGPDVAPALLPTRHAGSSKTSSYFPSHEDNARLLRSLDVLMAERMEQLVEDHRRATVAHERAENAFRTQLPFVVDALSPQPLILQATEEEERNEDKEEEQQEAKEEEQQEAKEEEREEDKEEEKDGEEEVPKQEGGEREQDGQPAETQQQSQEPEEQQEEEDVVGWEAEPEEPQQPAFVYTGDFVDLHLHDDKEFSQLATQYAELLALLASPRATPEDEVRKRLLQETMIQRAVALAKAASEEEAALREQLSFLPLNSMPFSAVPLRRLYLPSHSECGDLIDLLHSLPEGDINGQRRFEEARIQKSLTDALRRIADEEYMLDLRRWVDNYNIYEQYPFLPELPGGLRLCDIGWLDDTHVRMQASSLRAMDRVHHTPEEKKDLQQALRERTDELALGTLRATEAVSQRYPQLPLRVDGVLLTDLPLEADDDFQHWYSEQCNASSEESKEKATAQVTKSVRTLAQRRKALEMYRYDENEAIRARHPFFRYSEVSLLPLRDLRVEKSKKIRKVMRQRVFALGAPLGSADHEAVRQIDMELLAYCTLRAQEVLESNLKHTQQYVCPMGRESSAVPFHVLHALTDEDVLADIRLLHNRKNKTKDADDSARAEEEEEEAELARERIYRRCDELSIRYETTEERIAMELLQLRLRHPHCTHDVNPVVQTDECFAALRTMYVDWAKILAPRHELMQATEMEMKDRATVLVGDERCVLDAVCAYHEADAELRLSRCDRACAAEVVPLVQHRDEAYYAHQLWQLRHLRRRLPPLLCEEQVGLWDDGAWELFHAQQHDTYYLFLQGKKYEFAVDGRIAASRCAEELMKRRAQQLTEDGERHARALQRKHQAWLQHYHFLRVPPTLAFLSQEYLANDAVFRELDEERCRLLRPPVDITERYPFLATTLDGIRISSLGLDTDPVFLRVAASKENIIDPFRERLGAVKKVELELKKRFYECLSDFLDEEKRLSEKFAFLELPKFSLPLQDLHLLDDEVFQCLQVQYDEVRDKLAQQGLGTPTKKCSVTGHIDTIQKDNQDLRRKELLRRAMRDRALLLAREEYLWSSAKLMEMDSLRARLPMLHPEPVKGVRLTDLGLTKDPKFLHLAFVVEESRKAVSNIEGSSDATQRQKISAAENAEKAEMDLEQYVVGLAEDARTAVRKAQEVHPYLPERVRGVLASLLSIVPPSEVEVAAEEEEEEKEEEPHTGRNVVVLDDPEKKKREEEERYMVKYRAAAMHVKAVELYDVEENNAIRARNPFLEWNDVRGVPLVDLIVPNMDRQYIETRKRWLQSMAREIFLREEMLVLETQLRECIMKIAVDFMDKAVEQADIAKRAGTDLGCIATPLQDLVTAIDVPTVCGVSSVPEQNPNRRREGEKATLKSGELLFRADRAFVSCKNRFVEELRYLRESHPLVTSDVNPAISTDQKLQKLEWKHSRPMEDFTQHMKVAIAQMDSIAKTIRLRAASLVQDDAFVLEAAPKHTAASTHSTPRHSPRTCQFEDDDFENIETHPAVQSDRLEERCAYFIRDRHHFRRMVGFNELRERGGKLLPRRRVRSDNSKRSLSQLSEPVAVPDNDFSEIQEDSVDTSVVTSFYNPPESQPRQPSTARSTSSRETSRSRRLRDLRNAQLRFNTSETEGKKPADAEPLEAKEEEEEIRPETLEAVEKVEEVEPEPLQAVEKEEEVEAEPLEAVEKEEEVEAEPLEAVEKEEEEEAEPLQAVEKEEEVEPEPLQAVEKEEEVEAEPLEAVEKEEEVEAEPLEAVEKVEEVEPEPLQAMEKEEEEAPRAVIPPHAPLAELKEEKLRRPTRRRRQDNALEPPAQLQEIPMDQHGEVVERVGTYIDGNDSARSADRSPSATRKNSRRARRKQPLAAARLRASIRHAKIQEEDAAGEIPAGLFTDFLPEKRLVSKQEREFRETTTYIRSVLQRCANAVERPMLEEEVRASPAAMELVYEHQDLQHATSSQGPKPILRQRLVEIDEALIEWITSTTRTRPNPPTKDTMEASALAIKKERAIARRLQQQHGSAHDDRAPPGFTKSDALTTPNPRNVPQRWAHVNPAQLAQNDEVLRQMLSSPSASAQEVYTHICQASSAKEARNEALFDAFPFLPVICHGLSMEDVDFERHPDFIEAQTYGGGDLIMQQQRMCAVVGRLAREKVAAMSK